MGQGCTGDHDFVITDLGAGMARMACRQCGTVMIDLDAAKDGSAPVTTPGLFGPARPTIFSALAEARRAGAAAEAEALAKSRPGRGPRYAFRGSAPRSR